MPNKPQNTMPHLLFFFFFIFSLLSVSPSFSAHDQFLAPITKDYKTNHYTLSVYLKTPLQPTNLLLDLGATFTWVNCKSNYSSTTYHQLPCNSSLCLTPPHLRRGHPPKTPTAIAQASADHLALPITDGRNPGQLGHFPDFVFSCSDPSLLKGIRNAKKYPGLAGLGRSDFSLPAQVSSAFYTSSLFALCLSGSPSAPGVAFFNTPGPYYFLPEIDLSNLLIYTPLLSNPVGSTVKSPLHHSDEYLIGVKYIQVNGKTIDIDQNLLTVDQKGVGGTIISTVTPYTVLEKSIYKALTEAFVRESALLNLTVTNPVKPFSACYLADDVMSTDVGPAVPTVDIVMDGQDVFWRMFGSNSMVRIVKGDVDVWCLAFVDGGGLRSKASIAIGGHQLEDNLLQFDLGNNRLGFTSSVLAKKTMCANFNFTTNSELK